MGDCIYNLRVKASVRGWLGKKGISSNTKNLLIKGGDPLTITSVATQPDSFIKLNENPSSNEGVRTQDVDLGWKKTGRNYDDPWRKTDVKESEYQISPNFSTIILGEDDFFTKYTCIESFVGKAVRNRILYPMKDTAVYTDTDEILRDLKLGAGEGQAIPASYNSDFGMLTDESFSRIFFYGMGATLLAAQDNSASNTLRADLGPFVVDIPLHELTVRPGFRRYGCRIHFSSDQKVSAIHDYELKKTVRPGEDGWDQAKWLAKVNTFLFVTVREHLVWTHLIVSNAATRESTIRLPPNHPLRRLLTIFTYRSTEVNNSAFSALVPDHSVLHRSTAFTYDSMKKVFDSAYLSSNIFEPFPDREVNPDLVDLSDQGKFPFLSEGIAYYQVVEEFVRDWMSKAGDTGLDDQAKSFYEGMREVSLGQKYEIPVFRGVDDMVKLVTQIIFTVTAYHELVGNVGDYTIRPDRSGFRIARGAEETSVDVQSLLLTALIAASTSIRMPQLMAPYNNFFGAGGAPEWERTAWNSFVVNLQAQSTAVQAADSTRDVEFKYFDPARFECSVSV